MFILHTPQPKVVFFLHTLHLPCLIFIGWCTTLVLLRTVSGIFLTSGLLELCGLPIIDLSDVLNRSSDDTTERMKPNRSNFSTAASSLLQLSSPDALQRFNICQRRSSQALDNRLITCGWISATTTCYCEFWPGILRCYGPSDQYHPYRHCT